MLDLCYLRQYYHTNVGSIGMSTLFFNEVISLKRVALMPAMSGREKMNPKDMDGATIQLWAGDCHCEE